VSVRSFNASTLPEPQGYTHVSVASPGRLVHLAGQGGTDEDGCLPPDLADQTDHALRNLITALHAAGGGPEDLVKLTVYVVGWNQSQQQELGRGLAAASAALGLRPVPTTLVGVHSLYLDAMLVEIEGAAVLAAAPDSGR
jgi:enamine deaminase RidA (YjgF/YER057c/UK114 family)